MIFAVVTGRVVRSVAAMFLLVTGASGAGKSTVRRAVAGELSPAVKCVELHHIVDVPAYPDIVWRQRATEAVVQRALELQADHQAFAEWMRGHARDPRHMPQVLTTGGWEEMRWERWTGLDRIDAGWEMEVVDTSELAPGEVAAEVVRWCHRALCGDAPSLGRPGAELHRAS